jgi:hypothetical protein
MLIFTRFSIASTKTWLPTCKLAAVADAAAPFTRTGFHANRVVPLAVSSIHSG